MCTDWRCRDTLREQHQLSEEIGQAITSVPLGEQPDEDELDQELEGLEQEAMDERMLNTGPVPVNPQLDRLPEAGKSERKPEPSLPYNHYHDSILTVISCWKSHRKARSRGRGRRGRAGQAARGNGHVVPSQPYIPRLDSILIKPSRIRSSLTIHTFTHALVGSVPPTTHPCIGRPRKQVLFLCVFLDSVLVRALFRFGKLDRYRFPPCSIGVNGYAMVYSSSFLLHLTILHFPGLAGL